MFTFCKGILKVLGSFFRILGNKYRISNIELAAGTVLKMLKLGC